MAARLKLDSILVHRCVLVSRSYLQFIGVLPRKEADNTLDNEQEIVDRDCFGDAVESSISRTEAALYEDSCKRLGLNASEKDSELAFTMAKWLCSIHQWQTMFTGTFQWRASVWSAEKTFVKFMARHYADCEFFYCVEPNPSGEGFHDHGLIWRPIELYRREMWSKWFNHYGRARVEPVKCFLDAMSYCSKYVVKSIKTQDTGKQVFWNVHAPSLKAGVGPLGL